MKKVLLAFDGSHFSEGAFSFARQLHDKKKLLLTGAFLPQAEYSNLWSYSGGGMSGSVYIPLVEDEDAEDVRKNMERFEAECKRYGIEYRVHKNFLDFGISELKKETRFADLLVLGSESFYADSDSGGANEYLIHALEGVECPVIVVPEKFVFPKTNILAYDGSESSVFAIKQFAYLFPELTGNPTQLVYAKKDGKDYLPDEVYMGELAARHFRDLELFKFEGHPRDYFTKDNLESCDALLVCGSFGRKGLSSLFHKSFVNDIMKQRSVPIFIAHHQ